MEIERLLDDQSSDCISDFQLDNLFDGVWRSVKSKGCTVEKVQVLADHTVRGYPKGGHPKEG